MLDGTLLPAALRASHAIDAHKPDEAAGLILQALKAQLPTRDHARATAVITQLASIQAREEAAVIKEARAIFAAQQWTLQGNVYQAGGDIHIHTAPSPLKVQEKDKPLIEKWQTWVTLAVGLLTAITLTLGLLDKLPWSISPDAGGKAFAQPLAGQVIDASTGDPLSGVRIAVLGFTMAPQTTDQDGHFRFV